MPIHVHCHLVTWENIKHPNIKIWELVNQTSWSNLCHNVAQQCVSPQCFLYELPTSGDSAEESMDGVREDQSIGGLLDILWHNLAVSDAAIHKVPKGSKLDSSLWNVRASHWHQCLGHPRSAYTFWSHEARQCHVLGGTQSSLYQRNVWKWVVLASAQKSVRSSITNPMPKPSCWMVLHTVSPDALTYDQRKPAFICEDNGVPVVASFGVL